MTYYRTTRRFVRFVSAMRWRSSRWSFHVAYFDIGVVPTGVLLFTAILVPR
ncbi:hypothetical protein AArcCO_0582 [Halalkaliarchaeum sp. AArc-CO]|nr:hypothetical protein AArcCO_0582 [Halalkaliarchaeum sp. AArc-CO]